MTDEEKIEATAKANAQQLLRGELERKHKELDDLLMRSETLHPSASAVLQGQLEEEIEKLQAELNSLTAGER